MNWTKFKESEREYPDVVVENAISGFSKATNNLAKLGVSKKSPIGTISSKIDAEFQFNLILFSDLLEDYTFTVLEFGYDIELFPVKVKIESTILLEINSKINMDISKIISVAAEEDFKTILEVVFDTIRFKEIVAGLMKIAKRNAT